MNFPSVWCEDQEIVGFSLCSVCLVSEVFNHCCAVCLQVGVVDSPPRVFNSPYSAATSIDYNPMYRMSEFKVCNSSGNSVSCLIFLIRKHGLLIKCELSEAEYKDGRTLTPPPPFPMS